MTGYTPPGPLGLGTAPLGNLGTVVPEEAAVACLQAAWNAGIRHYDTAPHYGAGLAEHRLGHALRSRPRESRHALHQGRPPAARPDNNRRPMNQGFLHALPFRRTFDYTAAATVRSLEDSHQRMGLSRFDIVYIHDCSEDWHGAAWKERFAEAMAGAAQVLSAMRDRGGYPRLGHGPQPGRAGAGLPRGGKAGSLPDRRTLHPARPYRARGAVPRLPRQGREGRAGRALQFRAFGRRHDIQLRAGESRQGGACRRHPHRLRAPRHRHQGGRAAVLRGASGGGRRDPRPAQRRRSRAERRTDAGRDPGAPCGPISAAPASCRRTHRRRKDDPGRRPPSCLDDRARRLPLAVARPRDRPRLWAG